MTIQRRTITENMGNFSTAVDRLGLLSKVLSSGESCGVPRRLGSIEEGNLRPEWQTAPVTTRGVDDRLVRQEGIYPDQRGFQL